MGSARGRNAYLLLGMLKIIIEMSEKRKNFHSLRVLMFAPALTKQQVFPEERTSLLFRKSPFLLRKGHALGHCAERFKKKRIIQKKKHLALQKQDILVCRFWLVGQRTGGLGNWKEEDCMRV